MKRYISRLNLLFARIFLTLVYYTLFGLIALIIQIAQKLTADQAVSGYWIEDGTDRTTDYSSPY